jgi:hypothetical protein
VPGQLVSEFQKKGAYGGSAYKEIMHGVCAAELRSRTGPIYLAVLTCTVGAGAPATDTLRTAAKDWIAEAIMAEAEDLKQFLWKPRPAFGETGEADTLIEDARREQGAMFARIDNDFDRLRHARVERSIHAITRFAIRVGGALKFWR